MKSFLSQTVFCLFALLCAAAPALAQGDAEKHLRRSQERLAARDVDGAVAELDKAVALKPDYAEAYERRSQLRMLKGSLDGALADLDKAVEHAPDAARLYAARGRLRMMRSDAAGAFADFESAIARGHRTDEIYASRGHLKLTLHHDTASAVDDFTTAITLNPQRVSHYLGRATARTMAGDEAAALVDLNYVIEQHERREKERGTAVHAPAQAPGFELKSPHITGPERPQPPAAQGDKEQGGKDSGKTVVKLMSQTVMTVGAAPAGPEGMAHFEYMHNVAGAYRTRGSAHARLGDTEAALRDFDKSLEINPRSSPGHYARARTRRDLGQLEAALADFTRAAELDPQFPWNRLERAVTLLLLNRDAEAEKDFAEVVKLDPKLRKNVDLRRAETLRKREAGRP